MLKKLSKHAKVIVNWYYLDIDEEMYDDDRLETFLLKNRSKPATEFIEELIGDVGKFVGKAPQSDDITALYLKRL